MKFDLQPNNLVNNFVTLKPLDKNDFEILFAVANDKLLWKQHPNKLRYKRNIFEIYFEGALESKGAFLVSDSKTNETVGCSRFYDYDSKNNSVLIGYTFIGRKFWGKGYNKSVKKLMIEYAFQFVDTTYFHVGASNFRSQKAMEKIGGIKIDEFEVTYYGEESKMNYIYVIQKRDYKIL